MSYKLHWLTSYHDHLIDLYRRQVRTWEKIPHDLQKRLVEKVVSTINDRVTQQHGIQQESTVGFDDDIDALRQELGGEHSSDPT